MNELEKLIHENEFNSDDYLDFDTVNKTPTRLEMYNEGEYNKNHYNIEIYIKEVN